MTRTIDRALRIPYGRVTWTNNLAETRDTEPASFSTTDGFIVRVQLLRAAGYPPWPTAMHDVDQRYSDVAPTRLRVPSRDSFAASKSAAWFDRRAPRDLYDLWSLARIGALTRSAAYLFATHTGLGLPQDHMFAKAPTTQDWHDQLSGQTRLLIGPEDALQVVHSAWSAVKT